ncbi:hypothetical protein Q8A67_001358 [Cirrhinus molitorella]|uniref:AIG1-type G domain-containing protein n=1 Tax=Cirrhinus molitorella TaxID=172907 RepID=A0AA88QRA0_9TELE|nr:hypothetical protein Q8A67_001358 [Cirrhinus molitorella]
MEGQNISLIQGQGEPNRRRQSMEYPPLCHESPLTVVVFGNSTSVQSEPENILLGKEHPCFKTAEISRIVPSQREISESCISVINLIDLHEALQNLPSTDHLIGQLVNENEIHVFIFVVRLGQLTDADKMGLGWLQGVFGDNVFQFVMILFTYERQEECNTIKDYIKRNPDLQQLLEKCGGRYHTCNKKMNNQSEMCELIDKIKHLFNENKQQCYTGQRQCLQKSENESEKCTINKQTTEDTTTRESHKEIDSKESSLYFNWSSTQRVQHPNE